MNAEEKEIFWDGWEVKQLCTFPNGIFVINIEEKSQLASC